MSDDYMVKLRAGTLNPDDINQIGQQARERIEDLNENGGGMMLLTFVDPEGQSWVGAGSIGPILKGPNGSELISLTEAGKRGFKLQAFKVVEP